MPTFLKKKKLFQLCENIFCSRHIAALNSDTFFIHIYFSSTSKACDIWCEKERPNKINWSVSIINFKPEFTDFSSRPPPCVLTDIPREVIWHWFVKFREVSERARLFPLFCHFFHYWINILINTWHIWNSWKKTGAYLKCWCIIWTSVYNYLSLFSLT